VSRTWCSFDEAVFTDDLLFTFRLDDILLSGFEAVMVVSTADALFAGGNSSTRATGKREEVEGASRDMDCCKHMDSRSAAARKRKVEAESKINKTLC
jgi:hypothetical protein